MNKCTLSHIKKKIKKPPLAVKSIGLFPRLRMGSPQLMANKFYRAPHSSTGATHYALTMTDTCKGIVLTCATRHAPSEAKIQELTKKFITFSALTFSLWSIHFSKYITLGSWKRKRYTVELLPLLWPQATAFILEWLAYTNGTNTTKLIGEFLYGSSFC